MQASRTCLGDIMRRCNLILTCVGAVIGLMICGTLTAAPQKPVKQTARPGTARTSGPDSRQVTTIDQAIYKQKSQLLKAQIRDDKKRLKADKLKSGKDSPLLKTDRGRLRKDETALKQLQKSSKGGRKK